MRVSIGCDHRGFRMKGRIISILTGLGHEVIDDGPSDAESIDYPDVASQVAKRVSQAEVDRGILICGTGIGMAIVANKFSGVRAAPCYDEFSAEMSRRHNDLNVLCLPADMLSERIVNRLVDTWLRTEFDGGRHARRVEKISQLEGNHRQT